MLRFVGILLASAPIVYGQATLIQSVTVVDPATKSVLPQVDVLIAKGRIQAMGVVARPEDAALIDGLGRFLIPGLWDMHVHLWNTQNQPELYVAFGVTGVRDMGSDLARTRELRRSIEAGERIGPHIMTNGTGVDGRASTDARLPILVAGSPEAARQAVDQIFDSGADFVKVFSSIELEPYLALAERARQLRIPFAGHLPEAVKIEAAIEMRQASIEHLYGLDRAGEIRLHKAFRAAAEAGSRFTPTLTMHRRELGIETADPRHCLVLPSIRNAWGEPPRVSSSAARVYAHLEELVRWLQESGAAILAGTDTGDPFTAPGATLHRELMLLAGAGLAPMEVLKTATSEPARFLGIDGSTGSIRPGMYADLVLLDADPLKGNMENLARIASVGAKGRYIPGATVDSMRTCSPAVRGLD